MYTKMKTGNGVEQMACFKHLSLLDQETYLFKF